MKPVPGEIWFFDLAERRTSGHEQAGRRPCVVVSDPGIAPPLRFLMVSVVPLTTARQVSHPLYPVLPAGVGGLPSDSTALIDQLTALDLRRTLRRVGVLSPAGMAPIVAGLRVLLRL